ncbi:hypothetical protein Pse7367_2970 [Thalassoporum mexicanum PCC 7367]|nr:hypothetical protein Pse7367_2970 [Pseudanabaena sp. PCC 7367]
MEKSLVLALDSFDNYAFANYLHRNDNFLTSAIDTFYQPSNSYSTLFKKLENYCYLFANLFCLLLLFTSELGPSVVNWGLCAIRLCIGAI